MASTFPESSRRENAMGRQHGFYVVDNRTRKRRNPQTWARFEADVAVQALTKPRRKPFMTERQLANLIPGQYQYLRNVTRPCQFIKANRMQCKCWAMRGATRCVRHGGYRQVPEHPATVRLLNEGVIVERSWHRRASNFLYQLQTPGERQARKAAEVSLRYYGFQVRAIEVMEGAAALLSHDVNRWHRWTIRLGVRSRAIKAGRSSGTRWFG